MAPGAEFSPNPLEYSAPRPDSVRARRLAAGGASDLRFPACPLLRISVARVAQAWYKPGLRRTSGLITSSTD